MSADQPVGQIDDLRRRAVVTLQPDHDRAREAAREAEQVRRRRAGEAVDRLVGIADDAEVVAVTEPGIEQALLQRRDVLVLVDHEVPIARAHLFGDVGELLDRAGHDQQQVGEVELAGAPLGLLVLGVDLGHRGRVARGVAPGRRGPGRIVLRAWPAPTWPSRSRRPGRATSVRSVRSRSRAAALPTSRSGLSTHLGHRAAEHPGGEVGELAQGRGVEGAGLHPVGAERAQPGAQLPRRPGGEGDREQVLAAAPRPTARRRRSGG